MNELTKAAEMFEAAIMSMDINSNINWYLDFGTIRHIIGDSSRIFGFMMVGASNIKSIGGTSYIVIAQGNVLFKSNK